VPTLTGGSLNVYRMEIDLGDIPEEGSKSRRVKKKTTQQIEYEETMSRINKHIEKHAGGGESDDGTSDGGSDAGGGGGGGIQSTPTAAAAVADLARSMHLKSLGYTVKTCKIAGVAQIAPRPGSLRFASGDRGLGVVATGGSDGVLRLIRGGQIEDEAVAGTSITAVETSLCGHHVFASLLDGAIITRHIIADDGEGLHEGYNTGKQSGGKEEKEGGDGGGGRHGGGPGGMAAGARKNGGSSGGVTVRLHPHSRELRLPRSGVAITCMRLSPDGASLICGSSSGVVYIARVNTVINGLVHDSSVAPPTAPSAKPLAMVPLEDLRDRNVAILQLEEKVADTIKSSKFRVMMLEAENEDKLKAAQKKIDESAVRLFELNSVYPQLERVWFQHLILKSNFLLSNLAFKFNLYRLHCGGKRPNPARHGGDAVADGGGGEGGPQSDGSDAHARRGGTGGELRTPLRHRD
jgi:hypothetical protein